MSSAVHSRPGATARPAPNPGAAKNIGWISRVAIFLLLIVPSAHFAWRNRDMPDFARLHDDGLLFSSAKSLASGQGYRIPSLPENPYQTKYPPLYPALLSLIWKANPDFPANLPLAGAISWVIFAACIALCWRLYCLEGWSEKHAWLLAALLAVNPYMILFGCRLFSEIPFTCLLLAALIVSQREGSKWALAAGVLAGCAYLSRTAGVALLISMPVWYAWRRDAKRAGWFVAGMLPLVAAWSVWTRTHMLATSDSGLIYYVDYVRYQFLNVGWDNIGVVLWKNVDELLYGMGSLILPKIVALGPVKILTQVIAVAMISGVVRLVRRGVGVTYALFALVSAAMLIVWHFPPNERFVLPLLPLLAAGLAAEIEHLAAMLRAGFRHPDFGQRAVAGVFGSVVALVLFAGLALQLYVTFHFLDESEAQYRAKLVDLRAAYAWILHNTPPSAVVVSSDDPLLYLYSGRRGKEVPLMPRSWYAADHAAIVDAFRGSAEYCRQHGAAYIYSTTDDLARWTGDEDIARVEQAMRTNRALIPVFSSGGGTVYRVAER
jgi:hypothetical protein